MKTETQTITPAFATDSQDITDVITLLMELNRDYPGQIPLHAGNLQWCTYYILNDHDPFDVLHLYRDETGKLIGFALSEPHWPGMSFVLPPDLIQLDLAHELFRWSAEETLKRSSEGPEEENQYPHFIVDISSTLPELKNLIKAYSPETEDKSLTTFGQELIDLPKVTLPEGFTVTTFTDEMDHASRAEAHRKAFESERMTTEVYRTLREKVDRDTFQDVVVLSDEGKVCAYAICWLDPISKVGLLEPVGTHPDYQRMGLGKAVCTKALHIMEEAGMTSASVTTGSHSEVPINLYRSIGFEETAKIQHYQMVIA